MNRIVLLSAALLLLIASACKKDKSVHTPTCRLTTIQTNFDTSNVTYNTNGVVTSYGSLAMGLYTFLYSGLTASDSVETSSEKKLDCNISLDAKGRVTYMNRTTQFFGTSYYYTFNFQYNADGYVSLCEQIYTNSGNTQVDYYKDSMVYNNGNLATKYTFTRTESTPYVLSSRTECTYSSDLNKIGFYAYYLIEEPISVTNGWAAFYHLFGKGPVNLPLKTTLYSSTGDVTYVLDYTYLMDENGYPTEENIVRSILSPYSFNRKYSYSCE